MELILDQNPYLTLARSSVQQLLDVNRRSTTSLVAARNVPSGTYLLFNQTARLGVRVKQLGIVFERLCDQRQRLSDLDVVVRQRRVLGEDPDQQESGKVNERLRLDFESLYLIGSIALDLWACLSAHVIDLTEPEEASFQTFADQAFSAAPRPEFRPLIEELGAEIRGLEVLVKFYRNRFVTHVKRPWQISESRITDAYNFSFNCVLPSDPGRAALDRETTRMAACEGFSLVNGTPHQTLLELVLRLPTITDRVRQHSIKQLYLKHGALTPSFHVVAERLFRFLLRATEVTESIAIAAPSRVNIGRSW
jgi:hypothetical protein